MNVKTSLLLLVILSAISSASEPILDTSTLHVTTTEGVDVILPCDIQSLGRNKVVWIGPGALVLTIELNRVVDDVRFSILRNTPRNWSLVIRNTQVDDSGSYNCTLNTTPIIAKTVVLSVEAPARILIEEGLGRRVVKEGGDLVLFCQTSGLPKPRVVWTRMPKIEIGGRMDEIRGDVGPCQYKVLNSNRTLHKYQDEREEALGEGEWMKIMNITRFCAGTYKCVASNNHPPQQERSFDVLVDFAPEVHILSRRIFQYIDKETMLQCDVQAYPHGIVYWTKDEVRLSNSEKHQIEAFNDDSRSMSLSIRFKITEASDYGEYVCVAANEHGSDQASVHLLEYTTPTRQPLEETLYNPHNNSHNNPHNNPHNNSYNNPYNNPHNNSYNNPYNNPHNNSHNNSLDQSNLQPQSNHRYVGRAISDSYSSQLQEYPEEKYSGYNSGYMSSAGSSKYNSYETEYMSGSTYILPSFLICLLAIFSFLFY